METTDGNYHAIVFGASGVIGWSVVDQLLSNHGGIDVFSKVTAVTNRQVDLTESQWPINPLGGPEVQLISGIDLRQSEPNGVAKALKEKVRGVDKVSHIYYFAFTQVDDPIEEVDVNKRMLKNVLGAVTFLFPSLKFVVFPGGTRGYGIYIPGGTFKPPLTEPMVDNLPADYAKTVVYPAHREFLSAACRGKEWTWCEVCPDAIIGFTPNGSQYSLALHWAQYLSLYAYNHGIGLRTQSGGTSEPVEVPFPGNEAAYNALSSPVSARTLARFSIYASLHPETGGGGQIFNVADREEPSSFKDVWPGLAAWFGLLGVGPIGEVPGPVASGASLKPGEYIRLHSHVFSELGLHKALISGVGAGRNQLDSVGSWLTFDRQLSLKKLRGSGFDEERDPIAGWVGSFELFRKAGLIL
ncbi:hypothetical protein F5X99DRAFT_422359 [Biscogniauxia marginata]|nr:hypothetical protein F5X99DRAFT_422359 [Biscogniauxia marginata]